MNVLNTRITEIRLETEDDVLWSRIELQDIQKGRTFRMFEGDGEPIIGSNGALTWVAASDGFVEVSGGHGVYVETSPQQLELFSAY